MFYMLFVLGWLLTILLLALLLSCIFLTPKLLSLKSYKLFLFPEGRLLFGLLELLLGVNSELLLKSYVSGILVLISLI